VQNNRGRRASAAVGAAGGARGCRQRACCVLRAAQRARLAAGAHVCRKHSCEPARGAPTGARRAAGCERTAGVHPARRVSAACSGVRGSVCGSGAAAPRRAIHARSLGQGSLTTGAPDCGAGEASQRAARPLPRAPRTTPSARSAATPRRRRRGARRAPAGQPHAMCTPPPRRRQPPVPARQLHATSCAARYAPRAAWLAGLRSGEKVAACRRLCPSPAPQNLPAPLRSPRCAAAACWYQ
jgi:hypothetical protein